MPLNTGLIVVVLLQYDHFYDDDDYLSFFFLFTGYFRLGLRCRGLSVAVLFVSLLCRGWDRWLFVGAVRVLC